MKTSTLCINAVLAVTLCALLPRATAQVPVPPPNPAPPPPPHHPWIFPSNRPIAPLPQHVTVTGVEAKISLNDQVAATHLEISLHNPHRRPLESVLLLPCPADAVLKSFSYDGMPANAEGQAKILPRDEARRIYNQIVAQTKDPALLEFAGMGCVQSSVFPVPANGSQKVRLSYEQLLSIDGQRIDYVLPRSEAMEFQVPWSISASIKGTVPISTVYSPSHELSTTRVSPTEVNVVSPAKAAPGAFRMSVLREKTGELAASLLAYPDPKVGGGYFLLMLAPPGAKDAPKMKREVIVVLDKSGSMAGTKLDQVKAAALQVLEGLDMGEAFNLIVYNESVETFSPQPVVKSETTMKQARDYLTALRVSGGTNIHDALVEALRQKPTEGNLPLALFLTDGLPTVGQTSEKAIREVAVVGNAHKRRIFSFGVGLDVNTPLLSRIAREARGSSTFVLPQEDVEAKVGQVFKRLSGPILAAPELSLVDTNNQPVLGRVADLLPSVLPDIFEGDQLILLGRYTGEQALRFQLTGDAPSGKRTFHFEFQLDKATTANGFVPRLWASNKIGVLTEAIRDLGADLPLATHQPQPPNPKVKELVDEIVRLSMQFGILTEYTAFLATETAPLNAAAAQQHAADGYLRRALAPRAGAESLNQELNVAKSKEAKFSNNGQQWYFDKDMNKVDVAGCQQLADRGFFKRGTKWMEAGAEAETAPVDQVVNIGTPDFDKLVDELAADNRQSVLALQGEIILNHRGKRVAIR